VPGTPTNVGYTFFVPAQAAILEAAAARLIPTDELGPGAIEAGVPFFIDRQLAGAYGRAERWYMQGPWAKGESTQGYQSRFTPAQMYRAAIREIDGAVSQEHKAASFARLPGDQQDDWLHRLEHGEAKLPSADAKGFFKLLWQNVLEGFWCDPIHGGNRDMVGWKLIGFPGARYDQRPYLTRHGERYPLPPVALLGRDAWNKA
jgi:gluconate 2-dehydrogenase gamma chain